MISPSCSPKDAESFEHDLSGFLDTRITASYGIDPALDARPRLQRYKHACKRAI